MPGRNNPEFRRDIDWGKLRLGQAHPILLRHSPYPKHLAADEKILGKQQSLRVLRKGFRREQGADARALPTILGRQHPGFAKQSLLSIRLGIGIVDAYTQSIKGIQCVTDWLHQGLWADQRQLKHVRTHSARAVAQPLFKVMNIGASAHELCIHHQLPMQRDVGIDALDHGLT